MANLLELPDAIELLNRILKDSCLVSVFSENILRGEICGPSELSNLEHMEDILSLAEEDQSFLVDEDSDEETGAHANGADLCINYFGDKYLIPIEDIALIEQLRPDNIRVSLQSGHIDIDWMTQADIDEYYNKYQ